MFYNLHYYIFTNCIAQAYQLECLSDLLFVIFTPFEKSSTATLSWYHTIVLLGLVLSPRHQSDNGE
ncbi:hypothetical protein Plhal304r1_c068g0155961 [Plasmopara halstedii]